MPEKPPSLEALRQATAGLLFPSETDASFEVFLWPNETASKDKSGLDVEAFTTIASSMQEDAITNVKITKLETFFRLVTKEEDWHNIEEKQQVARFRELLQIIKATLRNVKVFRVGKTKINIYVVGEVEDGYAGLKTHVVET